MFLQESEYSTPPFGSTTFSNVFINLKYYPEYNNFNCFEQKISECGCKKLTATECFTGLIFFFFEDECLVE